MGPRVSLGAVTAGLLYFPVARLMILRPRPGPGK